MKGNVKNINITYVFKIDFNHAHTFIHILFSKLI